MGGKSGGGSTTTVQQADPWIGVQPHLLKLFEQGGQQYFGGGSTTAGLNPNITQANNMTRERAMQGNPTLGNANTVAQHLSMGRYAGDNPVMTGQMLGQNWFAQGGAFGENATAQGRYLGEGNPYLRDMVDAASRPIVENFQNAIAPSLASQFSAAGRMGSGSHLAAAQQATSTLGRQLSDTSTGIYGRAYESERDRMTQAFEAESQRRFNAYEGEKGAQRQMFGQLPQMQLAAAGMAPQLAQAGYLDANMLRDTGLLERDIYQQNLDDPAKRLALYSSILQGGLGFGSSTSTGNTSSSSNRFASAMGGAFMGNALGGSIATAAGGTLGLPGLILGGLAGGLFG